MSNENLFNVLERNLGKPIELKVEHYTSRLFWGIIFIVVVLLEVFRSFVFARLWNWFLVPLFGLPRLTTLWAIGILLPFYLIIHSYFVASGKNTTEKILEELWSNFWVSVIALIYGVIVKWLIGV